LSPIKAAKVGLPQKSTRGARGENEIENWSLRICNLLLADGEAAALCKLQMTNFQLPIFNQAASERGQPFPNKK
jgi:hypothetical protein